MTRMFFLQGYASIDIYQKGLKIKKENADQNFGRYPVYIYWTGIIPDRGKCRIYAGR